MTLAALEKKKASLANTLIQIHLKHFCDDGYLFRILLVLPKLFAWDDSYSVLWYGHKPNSFKVKSWQLQFNETLKNGFQV